MPKGPRGEKRPANTTGEAINPPIIDEPGMAERFQRGLQRALNTPHQPRANSAQKPKERPMSKARMHEAKVRN